MLNYGRGGATNWNVRVLLQVKGKLNQTVYHSILQNYAIPSGTQWLLDQGFVLMQINEPNHSSKLYQRYIKSKEEQNVLQLMFWSAQSANLNPIKLVQDELDRKGRTIFSISLVFDEKSAKNLWNSDSTQRGSFGWIKSLRSYLCFFWFNLYWMWIRKTFIWSNK